MPKQKNKVAQTVDLLIEAELELRRREGKTEGTAAISNDFTAYQHKPYEFGVEVLGERFTENVKAVMESVRDYPVTIAISANATGKSHGAARIATWFYKCFPDSQVYTTAAPPERNLRKILWGEIGEVTSMHPNVFASDVIASGMNVQRNSLSFITGVSIPASGTSEQREAKFSGKHAPNLLFIVDEGDAVPREVYRGIESCMSGGNARLLIMFNPRSDTGIVANMVKTGQGHVVHLSAFDHPNVRTGVETIRGAVTREKTVRRINEWTRPLLPDEKPDIESFEVPEFLVGSVASSLADVPYPPLPAGYRHVENSQFFYMVMGKYPPQSQDQLISRAWVDMAVSRWHAYVAVHGEKPPALVNPIIGIDVADMGADKNKMTMRWGGWVAPLRGWGGIDPDATAIRSVEILKQINIVPHNIKVFVDATGVGAGVAPRMARLGMVKAQGVMVASSPTYKPVYKGEVMGVFAQMRDQLWWSVMTWLRDDQGAMLPPDDELIEELCTPSYSVDNGTIRIDSKKAMKESLGRSPDSAESLIMTFAPSNDMAGAWR